MHLGCCGSCGMLPPARLATTPCALSGRRKEEDRTRLRSEAEAPFRALRLVLYGFSIVSASLATLISVPQLIGALGNARGALSTETVLQNLAINIGAITVGAAATKGVGGGVGCVRLPAAGAASLARVALVTLRGHLHAACCSLPPPNNPHTPRGSAP